jgi:alpha-methylacyl-CoA racemase
VQTGDLAKFSRTSVHADRVAPLLGQHSVEVLREAGIADARIDSLIASGVVVQAAES